MKLPENAQVRDITIQGFTFRVPEPFAAGHVLLANEAGVLNQTFAENIRNNVASTIEEAKTKAATDGTQVDVAGLQAQIDKYIGEYEFGANRGGARTVDPVMREALDMAEAKIKESIKARGENLKNVGAEKIRDLAKQLIEKYPQLLEQAKAVVEARKGLVLDISL